MNIKELYESLSKEDKIKVINKMKSLSEGKRRLKEADERLTWYQELYTKQYEEADTPVDAIEYISDFIQNDNIDGYDPFAEAFPGNDVKFSNHGRYFSIEGDNGVTFTFDMENDRKEEIAKLLKSSSSKDDFTSKLKAYFNNCISKAI